MNIQELDQNIARLEQWLADAPHEDDATSPNEHRRRWDCREQLKKWVYVLKAQREPIIEADAKLKELEQWLDFLTFARPTLCEEYAACDSRSPKRYGLELSIRQIDRGLPFNTEMLPAHLPLDDLLRIAGYQTSGTLVSTMGAGWRGCLPDVEKQVARLQQRRDTAQHKAAAIIASAQALIGEPVAISGGGD